jgi:glutathione S-transferase
MLAHPAMVQWEAEALAETWREDSHEAEIGAAGKIIADYRAA